LTNSTQISNSCRILAITERRQCTNKFNLNKNTANIRCIQGGSMCGTDVEHPRMPPEKSSLSNKLFTLYAKPRKSGEGNIKNAFRLHLSLSHSGLHLAPSLALGLHVEISSDWYKKMYGENSAFCCYSSLTLVAIFVCICLLTKFSFLCDFFIFWLFLLGHFKFRV